MADAFLVGGARTPRGRGRPGVGALSGVHPQELLAQTLSTLVSRAGVDAAEIEDVVIGCVTQANEQGACIARNAVLAARWPVEVTGVTLNRFCGSGLQSIAFAAMGVMSGVQDLVVAGGVESMSRVPMGADGGGIDGHNAQLRGHLRQVPQGIGADLIATLEGFRREDLDGYALESQRRAERAQSEGHFERSLFAVRDPATGQVVLDRDEHPRRGTTLEALASLKPAFAAFGSIPYTEEGQTPDQLALARYPQLDAIEHLHTAGTSSGIVDGAAAILVASGDAVQRLGLRARARVRAIATVGSEPIIMLTAPTPASRRALKKAGMEPSDIDLWEINEAFAAVPLQTMRNLELDPARVNTVGGSIALGHPLGATGTILAQTALDELERRGLGTALVTLCIGGGMGIAVVLERVG